jgi:hypothetical protein
VKRFLYSFNNGDAQQLDQLFAGPEIFQWYSTDSPGQRFGVEAKNRSSLMSYFGQRHQQHETLALRSFRFNGNGENVFGDFEYELFRSADDGPPLTPYVGKGAIDCTKIPRRLAVWSMARHP